jgi:predicted phage terminase large subunit-like protein
LPKNLETLLQNPELIDQELARRSLDDYARVVLELEPAKHHQFTNFYLEKVASGEIKRLMIFEPPGHAKSTYASVAFPAWFIGHNRTKGIICASHAKDLAEQFSRRVRNWINSDEYYSVFDLQLAQDSKAVGRWQIQYDDNGKEKRGAEYYAVGVDSSVTGRRANGAIIDDPVKGRKEADSEVVRESMWQWYLSDLRTRLLPEAFIVIIQTRWHEDDISGRILPEDYDGGTGWYQARDGEEWFVINLPALACENDALGRQPGEALWPEFYSKEMLAQERRTQGERNFSALYQQRPSPEEGNFFRREMFRFYDEQPVNLRTYGGSDYAVTADDGDYTVHGVIGVDPQDNIYILDWWRAQTESNVWIEVLLDLVRRWKPLMWAEESGQIIKSVGPFINKRMEERKVLFYRKQFVSAADKATRAQSFRARASMGKIYLPKGAPWCDDLLRELLTFPVGTHDDQVDVCSLFGRMLDSLIGADEPPKPRKTAPPRPPTFNEAMRDTARTSTDRI